MASFVIEGGHRLSGETTRKELKTKFCRLSVPRC